MPNRGELACGAAERNGVSTDDDAAYDAAWAIVQFCAIGWLISVYFAVLSEPIDYMPALIAQLPFE